MQAGRLPTWRSAIENPQPLVLALCVIATAILIGVELWSAVAAHMAAPSASHPHSANGASNEANIEQITAVDLFGHATNQNSNLPQTDLQVTLRAVFAASDPNAASAVIETNDGRAQMVKVGGAVGSAATLQAVYSNRVVLSRNGVLETLYFPTPQESTASVPVAEIPNTTASTGASGIDTNQTTAASAEEIKRAAILQRLEELRSRTPR